MIVRSSHCNALPWLKAPVGMLAATTSQAEGGSEQLVRMIRSWNRDLKWMELGSSKGIDRTMMLLSPVPDWLPSYEASELASES